MILIDYVNKSQQKIMSLNDIIEAQVRQGSYSDKELKDVIELIDFQDSLLSARTPWTAIEQNYWTDFMSVRHHLVDIPFAEFDEFELSIIAPQNISGSGYVTYPDLAIAVGILHGADNALDVRIDALENFDYTALLADLVADINDALTQSGENAISIATLISDLDILEAAFAAHIADNVRHITALERTTWNAKVSAQQLLDGLATKAALLHTHDITDVDGLRAELDALQAEINGLPIALDGEDGATPIISIGTVIDGIAPLVEIDPLSTPEAPIFNFTLQKGDQGDPFVFSEIGLIADRGDFDLETPGFIFLAVDTGLYYVLLSASTWTDGVEFKGWNGWTPNFGLYQLNADTVVVEIIGFTNGTGPVPTLLPLGQRYFLTSGGYTTIAANATNIKGNLGADGPKGDTFFINEQGTNISLYDAELKGFTFLNTATGMVFFKLSDTSGDWSAAFPWIADLTALTALVATKVTANVAITPATKTKITYDAKGLVTAGADATTADIADSSNKRYVTDANITALSTLASDLLAAENDAKSYADGLVVGLWDDRGSFDASVNAYPSGGGSGTAGAIMKGDVWTISVAGTLPTGQIVEIGDLVRSLIDTPGNTQANWAITQNNIGYTAENSANKTDTVTGNTASSSLYLSVKGYYDWLLQGLTQALTAKVTPIDADAVLIEDSADSNKTKKTTWTNVKAFLKTYFDTVYLALSGGSMTGAINEAKGIDIASAATTDIGAATGNYVVVTGVTTITALGTIQAGTRRIINFSGILLLTHNATSLILPTGANITTQAGDVVEFVSLGGGDWKCTNYERADGSSLVGGGGGVSGITGDGVDNTDPANPIMTYPLPSDIDAAGYLVVTKGALDTLISGDDLIPGTLYKITGVDTALYGGTDIFLKAATVNKLELSGHGIFYTPKYDQTVAGYKVWNIFMVSTVTNVVGTFDIDEPVTADNSATGIWKGAGVIQYVSGSWTASVSITGDTNAGTADIAGQVVPSYSAAQRVIWGGKHWDNNAGAVGTATDKYTLSAAWTVVAFNATDYNVHADEIQYDYVNNQIVSRKDRFGNQVSGTSQWFAECVVLNLTNPIKDFQWGNGQDDFDIVLSPKGVMSNNVIDSYFDTLNFIGTYVFHNTLTKGSTFFSNTIGSSDVYIEYNTLMTSAINSNSFSNGSTLSSNILSNSGSIYNNRLNAGAINGNILNDSASISDNVLDSSSISDNKLNIGSAIYLNVLNSASSITFNDLVTAFIHTNTFVTITYNILSGNSTIQSNSCSDATIFTISYNNLFYGNIDSNTSSGENNTIDKNSIQFGSIVSNVLVGAGGQGCFITTNLLSAAGTIDGNTLGQNGVIEFNDIKTGGIYYNTLDYTAVGSTIVRNIFTGTSGLSNTTLDDSVFKENILNKSLLEFTAVPITKTIAGLRANDAGGTFNLSASTIIFNSYSREMYKNSSSVIRISYFNGSNVFTAVAVTA